MPAAGTVVWSDTYIHAHRSARRIDPECGARAVRDGQRARSARETKFLVSSVQNVRSAPIQIFRSCSPLIPDIPCSFGIYIIRCTCTVSVKLAFRNSFLAKLRDVGEPGPSAQRFIAAREDRNFLTPPDVTPHIFTCCSLLGSARLEWLLGPLACWNSGARHALQSGRAGWIADLTAM